LTRLEKQFHFVVEYYAEFGYQYGMSTDALLLPDATQLPDEPAILKQLVVQLFEELQKERARVQKLEHHMDLLLRRIYGRSSEKFDQRQGALFDLNQDAPLAPVETPAPPKPRSVNRHAHGRGRIPETIERVEVVHDLTEAEKASLGGAENLIPIGEEITEQYEWKPSCLFALHHIQKKYARREQLAESGLTRQEQNVIVAQKPPQAIPGCLAGPGLLAQVIVSKYADHLPLYRLEGIFERQGVKIPRQTTDGWALGCAEFLRPLYELMIRSVLASRAVHTDDTPVRVRDAWKKLKHTGRFWTYVGDEEHPLVVFDYTPSRQRDGPAEFLKTFKGYLQADAFGGYDGIFLDSQGEIQEVGCWAHARRKFFDGRKSEPPHAETALAWIGKLYAVEKELRERLTGDWKDLPLADRHARIAAFRQEQSRPLLGQFHAWLESEVQKVLPKNPVRQAMDYTLSNYAALCRYTEHGSLDIDNNVAENALRGIALGRKNWLFCGSDRGGRAAAIHFSLLASCKRRNLDPLAYLRNILIRLPQILPAASLDELRALLPDHWQPVR
jgi:transposase